MYPILPVPPWLLLVQLAYVLITFPCTDYGIVQAWIIASTVTIHGLTHTMFKPSYTCINNPSAHLSELDERFADLLELSLVVVLTLGGLVSSGLGKVLHGNVELHVELAEDLHLAVT